MPELPKSKPSAAASRPISRARASTRSPSTARTCAFPSRAAFVKALEGQTITAVGRRAKYLLFHLSLGKIWLGHLGMTGAFRFAEGTLQGAARAITSRPRTESTTIW